MENFKDNSYTFWEVVEKLNWRETCKNNSRPYNITKGLMNCLFEISDVYYYQEKLIKIKHHLREIAKSYRTILQEKCNELSVKRYGERGRFPNNISDDSLWDLCSHIIGCGETIYNEVYDNPEKILDYLNEYKENFEYTFNEE